MRRQRRREGREESKPSSVPDGHLSRYPEPEYRSRRRLRDCSRLLASASNRLCRPVRRLLQGGLPFSLHPANRLAFVAVALATTEVVAPIWTVDGSPRLPGFHRAPRSTQLGLSSDPWASDHPSSQHHAAMLLAHHLSKYRPHRGRCGQHVVPKGRLELPRPYEHYALNVARLPIPPLRPATIATRQRRDSREEYTVTRVAPSSPDA